MFSSSSASIEIGTGFTITSSSLRRCDSGSSALTPKGRARYIGYRTVLPRAIIYAVSAAVCALGGLLFALYTGFVSPGTLHWSLSGEALIMAIIGGPRLVWGPGIAAAPWGGAA